ncbi:unnamed protein product [Callosobruchus maculatus]|uniref:Uncharacterized protein n=1 Tax=Callosobruchus maculatus TaxID=64391 RepID=A0A653BHG8_CALMS|nr:unnamed protein product [Callosobruchus maculatus]
MPVAGMRMAVREVRRADPPLQEAHRRQTVQMRRLRKVVREVGPPGAPHEAPSTQGRQMSEAPSSGLRRFR